MAAPVPTYDLMLLLDPKADDAVRAKIRADVRALVEGGGTLLNDVEYGSRTLAFEIRHGDQAEYDLLQFQGPVELLETLNRTLRITDGVVRFRIIKAVGEPTAPDLRQSATAPPVVEGSEQPVAAEHAAS